jgi:hypothetical protein
MKLATPERFHGEWYTDYRYHEGFAKRARLLSGFPDPVLVVGCAFGYTVAELRKLGRHAHGIDASEWAVSQQVTPHVYLANALDEDSLATLPGGPFPTVFTEDLLPCLSDTEAQLAAINCARLSLLVIHGVTERGDIDLNYHPAPFWTTLLNQLTFSLEGL